jgi:hypothetical protein
MRNAVGIHLPLMKSNAPVGALLSWLRPEPRDLSETPLPGEPLPRLRWEQLCRRPDCRGRWVALHECHYDDRTGKATDGELVDVDADLASLCNRVRDSHWKDCAILFCDD